MSSHSVQERSVQKRIARVPKLEDLLVGRITLDEGIEKVKRDGVIFGYEVLRRALLHGLGLRRRKTAENLVISGCLAPFGMPMQLVSYFRLLDCLGINYTYLKEREYCCGYPLVRTTKGAKRRRAEEASREFIRMNVAQARELEAKNMVYFCTNCAHLAKRFFPEEDVAQMYYPDILLDRLDGQALRLEPTVIAYYEGCHNQYRAIAPSVRLDWEAYRQLLSRIEGLKVVDLPHKTCCLFDSPRIVEEAKRNKVSLIVCSCTNCWTCLDRASRGSIAVKLLPQILLDAIEPRLA